MEKEKSNFSFASCLVGYLGIAICAIATIAYLIIAQNGYFGITFNKYILFLIAFLAEISIIFAIVLAILGRNAKNKKEDAPPADIKNNDTEVFNSFEDAVENLPDEELDEDSDEEFDDEPELESEPAPDEEPTPILVTEENSNEEQNSEPVESENDSSASKINDDLTAAEIFGYLQRKVKEVPKKAADTIDYSVQKIKDALPTVAATVVTVAIIKNKLKKKTKK